MFKCIMNSHFESCFACSGLKWASIFNMVSSNKDCMFLHQILVIMLINLCSCTITCFDLLSIFSYIFFFIQAFIRLLRFDIFEPDVDEVVLT